MVSTIRELARRYYLLKNSKHKNKTVISLKLFYYLETEDRIRGTMFLNTINRVWLCIGSQREIRQEK